MDTSRDQQDRIVSNGERPVKPESFQEQSLPPKDERIGLVNPSPDASIMRPLGDGSKQPESSDVGVDFNNVHNLNVYVPQEQTLPYGYGGNTGNWDGYSPYGNPDGLHLVSPVVYNENPSVMFHSGYGFSSDMPYGQYSPVATPMPSLMVDNQLYPSQQVPFSPSYYQQTAPQPLHHISSGFPISPTELFAPESSNSDSTLGGPGSGYYVHFGSFGGGNLPVIPASNPLTSPAAYPPPMGILGSYEHNVGQMSQQQRPLHAYGFTSNSPSGRYPHGGMYQGSHFGGASISYAGLDDRNRIALDKERRRDRGRDSIYLSNAEHDIPIDRNRGPRASKLKGKNTSELGFSSISRNEASGIHIDLYNRTDFVTDYETAKFYVIKSFSEDNIHKSIKYSVWASTPHGNKKLDAAFNEAKNNNSNCPVFLLFSVNGSGQFCGVAEMIGPVDFEKDADYWQQDRWSGQFPVKWYLIKDVPNNQFRHILLENNDNKPVTHSRDSQEVKLEHGIEMLKVFKGYDSRTSIIDDFEFYDERERALKERKSRQRASFPRDTSNTLVAINEMSDSFAQALQLEVGSNKGLTMEKVTSSRMNDLVPFTESNKMGTSVAGMGAGDPNLARQQDDNSC